MRLASGRAGEVGRGWRGRILQRPVMTLVVVVGSRHEIGRRGRQNGPWRSVGKHLRVDHPYPPVAFAHLRDDQQWRRHGDRSPVANGQLPRDHFRILPQHGMSECIVEDRRNPAAVCHRRSTAVPWVADRPNRHLVRIHVLDVAHTESTASPSATSIAEGDLILLRSYRKIVELARSRPSVDVLAHGAFHLGRRAVMPDTIIISMLLNYTPLPGPSTHPGEPMKIACAMNTPHDIASSHRDTSSPSERHTVKRSPTDTLDRMTDTQPSAPHPSSPVDATYLTDAVFRLERAIGRIGNKRLAAWNLSLSGYAALKILQTRTDLSLAQLSRRCFVRPQTMTRIVSQLEERGYVRRRPHPESDRAIALALTDFGRQSVAEMDSEVLKINETLTRELDADGVAFLEGALRRCAAAVEAELRDM